MKVIITGANGLLGQKLIQLFAAYSPSTKIVAISEGDNEIEVAANYNYLSLDITNSEAITTLIEDEKADYLVNCAAITNVDRCELQKNLSWNVNVEAVKTMTDVCQKTNTFLIQISTDFIFDGKKGPYKETDKTKPSNFYGTTKLESEKYIIDNTINYCIIRTIQVYGFLKGLKRPNIVTWVKNTLQSNHPIQAIVDQYRTPTLAEDLAMGVYLAIEKRATGIYNIASEQYLSLYDIIVEIAKYFNLDSQLISPVKSKIFPQIAKRPRKTGLIIKKAKAELGFKPHTLKQGIKMIDMQMNSSI